jgi:hypothetical protein
MYLELRKGFEVRGITFEDAVQYWKYVRSSDHYRQLFPGKELPAHEEECVCGHEIVNQCWIYRLDCPLGIHVLTLGNCCIKNYFPKGFKSKLCEVCGATHKNRKDNVCKTCRADAASAAAIARREAEAPRRAAALAAEEGRAEAEAQRRAAQLEVEAQRRATQWEAEAPQRAAKAAAEEAKAAAQKVIDDARRLPRKALRALLIAKDQQAAFELDLALKRAGVRH